MRLVSATDPSALDNALAVLRAGGIVVHATETCYGIACDIANADAIAKLFAIKHRPVAQPVSGLFASVDQAKQYVEWTARADELAAKHLPGPLTLILPLLQNSRLFPTPAGGTTLGVRISSHSLAQQLVESFGSPLTTTSANIHGEPNPYNAQAILDRFSSEEHQPDLLLDAGTLPHVPPSTVVDVSAEGTTRRQGGIAV